MKVTWYVPIYEWGENPCSVSGMRSGVAMYQSLQDLYGFEPDAIAYFEVEGIIPTKAQFENLTQCGAW